MRAARAAELLAVAFGATSTRARELGLEPVEGEATSPEAMRHKGRQAIGAAYELRHGPVEKRDGGRAGRFDALGEAYECLATAIVNRRRGANEPAFDAADRVLEVLDSPNPFRFSIRVRDFDVLDDGLTIEEARKRYAETAATGRWAEGVLSIHDDTTHARVEIGGA